MNTAKMAINSLAKMQIRQIIPAKIAGNSELSADFAENHPQISQINQI
jgi:hypothetical protein